MQVRYSWSRAAEERLGERIDAAFEAASEAEERAQYAATMQSEDSALLAAQLGALQKDVSRLTAMVGVLAEALAQRGVIDMNWALGRLGQELAKIDPPPPPAPPEPMPPVMGYRDPVEGEASPVATLRECVACGVAVAETRTYVTERGMVCEACYEG